MQMPALVLATQRRLPLSRRPERTCVLRELPIPRPRRALLSLFLKARGHALAPPNKQVCHRKEKSPGEIRRWLRRTSSFAKCQPQKATCKSEMGIHLERVVQLFYRVVIAGGLRAISQYLWKCQTGTELETSAPQQKLESQVERAISGRMRPVVQVSISVRGRCAPSSLCIP